MSQPSTSEFKLTILKSQQRFKSLILTDLPKALRILLVFEFPVVTEAMLGLELRATVSLF